MSVQLQYVMDGYMDDKCRWVVVKDRIVQVLQVELIGISLLVERVKAQSIC